MDIFEMDTVMVGLLQSESGGRSRGVDRSGSELVRTSRHGQCDGHDRGTGTGQSLTSLDSSVTTGLPRCPHADNLSVTR